VLAEKYPSEIQAILAKYPDQRSAVLPLMYLAQEAYGFVSKEAMRDVASVIGLDATEVLSLAGYYTLFYEEPVGKYVLEICTDLPCALRGAEEFADMACHKLGVEIDETTDDGMFTVKKVMCLAACDKAPMLQVNLKFEENLDEEKFDALITRLRQEAADGQAHYYGVEALKNSLEQQ